MQVTPEIKSVVKPSSIGAKAALRVRRRIYKILEGKVPLADLENVLDVGVTSDVQSAYSNFFECFYPHIDRVTALSDQDAGNLEDIFPGLTFVKGDGCALPFEDNSFDLVFSSAVIEHVGSFARQEAFIREAFRVSRKYVFITTPNRWHPVELHTYLPFLHYLPKKMHRRLLRGLGMEYLSCEENLNLLDRKSLKNICRQLDADWQIDHVRFLGFPSNLLLSITKNNG